MIVFVPENLVKVAGTAFEMGKMQGEKSRTRIAGNVAAIAQSIKDSELDMAVFEKMLDGNLKYFEATEPDLVEEMRGIASGAGLDFHDIAIINVPLYFLLDVLPQECSSVVVRASATLDGKTYMAKTRDMKINVQQIALERTYPDGRRIVEVNGAGILTYPGIGINSNGLAVCTTGAWSKKIPIDLADHTRSHILLNIHSILEKCSTVDQAIAYLHSAKRMNGMNMLIADNSRAVAVEATRNGEDIENCSEGYLVRTNNYISAKYSPLNPNRAEYPSTFARYERISGYVRGKHGTLRFQDLLEIMSDHSDGENCVCRHGLGANKGKTVSMSMVVLEDHQLWTTTRNPCEAMILSKAEGKRI